MGSTSSTLSHPPKARPKTTVASYQPLPMNAAPIPLNQALDMTRRDILCIDEELRCVQRTWNRLLRQRQLAQHFVDTQAFNSSAFRKLPNEIISEIILHELSSSERGFLDGPTTTLNTKEGPWKYGQICRAWRGAVLSHPRLWSKMVIRPRVDTSRRGVCSAVLAELLHRSRDLTLTVRLEWPYIPVEFRGDHRIGKVLDILVTQCHRWKDVTISNLPATYLEKLDGIKGCVPQLVTLKIDLPAAESDPAVLLDTFDAFEIAPLLKDLTLDLGEMGPNFVFPWPQLEICNVTQYRTEQFPHILPYIHHATECQMREDQDSLVLSHVQSPIYLPRLGKLTEVAMSLEFIAAPGLKHLKYYVPDRDLRTLRSFLDRSACHSLQYLELRELSSLHFAAVDNLRTTPTLNNLTVLLLDVGEYDDSPFITYLTILTPSETIFLPKLETLKLNVHYQDSLNGSPFEALVDMLESRSNSLTAASLQVFYFQMTAEPQELENDPYSHPLLRPETKQRFEELGDNGLRLLLTASMGYYELPEYWDEDIRGTLRAPRYISDAAGLLFII